MRTIKKNPRNSFMISRMLCYALILGLGLLQSCTVDAVEKVFDELEELAENAEGVEKLKGDWIRVSSSNANNDGMIIRVLENTGKVTTSPISTYTVGDVKWKNIDVVDEENYIHEELGSDKNYYSASMELRSDDTLRIEVQSAGAGNFQKWVRN